MLTRVKAGEGSLGLLVKDDRLASSLASTAANLDEMTGKLRRGKGRPAGS